MAFSATSQTPVMQLELPGWTSYVDEFGSLRMRRCPDFDAAYEFSWSDTHLLVEVTVWDASGEWFSRTYRYESGGLVYAGGDDVSIPTDDMTDVLNVLATIWAQPD